MSLIGYARVSTSEGKQLLDRQVDALKEIGCERIFEDKASGSNSQRKGLDDCLNYLRKGDVLVVLDLDRLGRLASDLIKLIDELAEKDIGFKAINSPMDTTTPAGRAFLQIQAAFAEMERNIIRQRVKEGIAAARARGRKGGRPRIMTAPVAASVFRMLQRMRSSLEVMSLGKDKSPPCSVRRTKPDRAYCEEKL